MVKIKEKITQTKNYMRRIIRKTRKLLSLIQLYPDHLRPKQVNPVSNDEVVED